MAVLVCLCRLPFSNLAIHLKPNVAKSVKEIWQAVVRDCLERLGFSFGTASPDVRKFLERRVFFSFVSQLNVYLVFSVSNDHPEVFFFWGGDSWIGRISVLFVKKNRSPPGLQAVLGKIQDALIVPSNYMYSAWELGIINMPCDSLQE